MNTGKTFEYNFKNSITNNLYYQRIKDPANSFGKDSSFNRFSLPNPYDCFLYNYPYFYAFELKNTQNNSISIQRIKEDKSKMIKLNQIKELQKASKHKGIFAGFLFNFTNVINSLDSKCYYLSIEKFIKFLDDNKKKSINLNDILNYGGIEVEIKLKKVNYIYNVEKLLIDIQGSE